MSQAGLRERKKAATRSLIVKTADRLFATYGFDEVPLDRVADECLLSVKTVLRYFPTKEALALDRLLQAFEHFRVALANRDTDAVSCFRRHVELTVTGLVGQEDFLRRFEDMVTAHPDLEAHAMAVQRKYEDLLAQAISEESGDSGVRPRLLAAVLMASNSAVFRAWYQGVVPWDPQLFGELLDFTVENFNRPIPLSKRRRVRTEAGRRKLSPR